MFLKSLHLRNFRNYTDTCIHFGPRVNVIAGNNAQGKTNLLEAIYLLSCGRSFRTTHLNELIQKGKNSFYLEANVIKNGISEMLRLHYDGKLRKFQYNSTLHLSFNPLLGIMPSVLHAPTDINLISGTPALRRRFLNIHLAQHDPIYVHHLLRFYKAMKQRNSLLKIRNLQSIECWEDEMASSASYLMIKRSQMLSELQKHLQVFAKTLGSLEALDLKFSPSLAMDNNSKAEYLKQLKDNRNKEMALGATLVGPHRDDFHILINENNARTYASEGQKGACLFALRLSEWERLCEQTEVPSIMSIDDFGVHLDMNRQKLVQNSLQHLLQVFITTPNSHLEWEHTPQTRLFIIEDGRLAKKEEEDGLLA